MRYQVQAVVGVDFATEANVVGTWSLESCMELFEVD